MRRLNDFCIDQLLLLLLGIYLLFWPSWSHAQLPANCAGSSPKVIIAGDSWAQYIADDGWHTNMFNRYGHADKTAISQTYESEILCSPSPGPGDYAVSGSEARQWADESNYDYLQNLINALNAQASIDMVLLSIGGNDILAGRSGGGWYKDMDLDNPGSEQALFDTITAHTLYIIDQIWARSRSDINILISSYDYPNFNVSALWCGFYACDKREDLSRDANNNGTIDPSELITDQEINQMMIGVERIRQDLADGHPQIFYDNSLGLMHYYYGYDDGLYTPALFEGSTPHPQSVAPYAIGGDSTYPTDRNNFRLVGICGVGGFLDADPIHLDADAYEIKTKNQFDNILFERYRGSPDMTFWSEAINDGYVDVIENTIDGSGIRVGDDGPFCCFGGADNDYRGILSFNTAALPDDAIIEGASIYLIRSGENDNPFLKGDRNPVLDIKSGFFGSSTTLEVADGTSAADFTDIGCFHGLAESDDYAIRIDIQESALSAINVTGSTQMRFYFDFSDWSVEYINFYDGGGQAAFAPQPTPETKYTHRTIKKSKILNSTVEKTELISVGNELIPKDGYDIQEKLVSREELEDGSIMESYKSVFVLSHSGMAKYMLDNYGAPGGGTAPFLDVSFSLLLPIELSRFEANPNGNDVELQWTSNSEINFDGFYIEHQRGNETWMDLDFVKGSTHSSEPQNYEYTHVNPGYGLHKYRLRMVDLDSMQEFSVIRSVSIDQKHEGGLTLTPNPANNLLTIEFDLITTPTKISVYGPQGQRIMTRVIGRTPSSEKIDWDISHLPDGLYYVILETDGTVIRSKFTKN